MSFVSDINRKNILRWSNSHLNRSFCPFQRHRPGGGGVMGEPAAAHPRAASPREEHRRPRHHQGDQRNYRHRSCLHWF